MCNSHSVRIIKIRFISNVLRQSQVASSFIYEREIE